MLGSIIGDIIGSIYEVKEVEAIKNNIDKKRSFEERIKILDNNTPLFIDECSYTDDSVLTTAIADAILNNLDYEATLKEYGLKELDLGNDKYGRSRFDKGFIDWLYGLNDGISYGNGSAMRISSIGFLFDDIETIKKEVLLASIPSHNNIEAIKGAEAVAITIYLARIGKSKEEIKKFIEENYYNLDYNLMDLQKNYRFSSKCSNSVPQALFCFFESNGFLDAIRKGISIGGDSDTIACIVGGISEAYYGIPEDIINEVYNYIPKYIFEIIKQFYLRKSFLDFMNEQTLFTKEFQKFVKDKIVVIDEDINNDWYGCFPIIKNDILVDIRVLIPRLKDKQTLLTNIHEYCHAMELYNELGSVYTEQENKKEDSAIKLEKKFINKEKEYDIYKYCKKIDKSM